MVVVVVVVVVGVFVFFSVSARLICPAIIVVSACLVYCRSLVVWLQCAVQVITQDNVMIDIDSILYFRITDARLAVYNIQNLPDAIELLTQATLRDIIAGMNLDDTFSSREEINDRLLSKIQLDCERWGVVITRIEIFNILPPGMPLRLHLSHARRLHLSHARRIPCVSFFLTLCVGGSPGNR